MTTTPTSPMPLRLENRHTGEVLELRRLHRKGEAVLELRGTLPPHREGPPTHIHHVEDEEGRVIGGTLSAEIGGQRLTAGPGHTVRLPRKVAHRWWKDGDEPLFFEGLVRPIVDLDRYLQAVFEVMNAGAPNRPPLFYLAHVALRHPADANGPGHASRDSGGLLPHAGDGRCPAPPLSRDGMARLPDPVHRCT